MRKPDPSEGYGDLGKGCWLLPTILWVLKKFMPKKNRPEHL